MEDLVAKISSYNIFNNLVPGALFAFLISVTDLYTLEFKSIVVELAAYYVMGLIVSRVGSIILEPALKKVRFIQFASYSDFIEASRIDSTLSVLSESNNLYRTIAASLLCFPVLYGADKVANWLAIDQTNYRLFIIGLIACLFVFSYRKQTSYIRKRVETVLRLKSKYP